MDDALLMDRTQAAEALNMSLSHFQRHVQNTLPSISSGQLRFYRPVSLRRWIDAQIRPPRAIGEPAGPAIAKACDQLAFRFEPAHEKFIQDCHAGVALNNRGKPYKPKAILSLDSALRRVPGAIRRKRLVDVAGFEFQQAIDGFIREGLSASRVHSIICAVRSLDTWAIHRGRAVESPTATLRLPAISQESVSRIVTPGEFVELLDAIPAKDALAWAIAGYATARHQEIKALDWSDVNFDENTILLGGHEEARKSEAARRVVPMIEQLRVRMRAGREHQRRPESGPVFKPRRADNRSGTADLNAVLRRITKRWHDLGMEPISFQDSRHTAATWLDHAGVSPKVASVIMGHKTPHPSAYPEAAPITLRRYTHVLEGELWVACARLENFLSEREIG